MMKIKSNYFYGNEVSDYGKKYGYVDYRTLAKSFDAVMNNDIMQKTAEIGYWESIGANEEYYEYNGNEYSYNELDELRDEYDDESEEYEAISEAMDNAYYHDEFQYFIVSENGAEILQEAGEIVYYNEALDMYVWAVTHYGTSWDYVLTNIKIEKD